MGIYQPGTSKAAINRSKLEERRDRNFSLYKTNQVQKSTTDQRSKNSNILKGVRLNRRFELMMKNRKESSDN
jgi:hypothetical protein